MTDLEFGTLDADKAIAAKLKHEGKLDDKVDAYFQCASLYTSATGERRVRVHNLAVPVSSLISSVFRAADMDTTIAFFTKECASRSLPRRRRRCLEERAEADLFPSSRAAITVAAGKTLRQVRESLSDSCAKALLAYRKHCASSTSPAQLILPESFKLFPLYALALMKTKALKGGVVASDVRTWAMRQLKSAGVPATVRMLYPRMLAVHQFADEVGFPDERGQLILPPLMRTSYSRMEPHGAYLVENGEKAFLWLGASVSPQILQDLYGVENLDELDTRMVRPSLSLAVRVEKDPQMTPSHSRPQSVLPNLPTRLSAQLRNIITYFESRYGIGCLPVLIARQNIDGTEFEFSNMLVEDSNNEQLSYIDFLCLTHQVRPSISPLSRRHRAGLTLDARAANPGDAHGREQEAGRDRLELVDDLVSAAGRARLGSRECRQARRGGRGEGVCATPDHRHGRSSRCRRRRSGSREHLALRSFQCVGSMSQ